MHTFSIIADSREQIPYAFTCPTIRKMLDAGDYSVAGLEGEVAVERKSLADFARTIIHDWDRFAIELTALARQRAACVVVEADLDRMLRGGCADELRGARPATLLGAAHHISIKYRVPVFWCGSRQAAREFTETYLRTFARIRAEEARGATP